MENQSSSENPTGKNPKVDASTSTEFNASDLIGTTTPILTGKDFSKSLVSERLIIRTYDLEDFFNYESLHSQPEPYILGTIYYDNPFLRDVSSIFDQFVKKLQPWCNPISYGIFIKNIYGKEGDYIGEINLSNPNPWGDYHEWPHISYMIKKEYWGKGYGTETVKTFTSWWWNLKRFETSYSRMVSTELVLEKNFKYTNFSRECLVAFVEHFNKVSCHILEKVGFEKYKEDNKVIFYRMIRPGIDPQFFRNKYKEGGTTI